MDLPAGRRRYSNPCASWLHLAFCVLPEFGGPGDGREDVDAAAGGQGRRWLVGGDPDAVAAERLAEVAAGGEPARDGVAIAAHAEEHRDGAVHRQAGDPVVVQ